MFTRREMLKTGTAFAAAAIILPRSAFAEEMFAPTPGSWREFEVLTRVDIPKSDGKAQAWIPLPSVNEDEWIKRGKSSLGDQCRDGRDWHAIRNMARRCCTSSSRTAKRRPASR